MSERGVYGVDRGVWDHPLFKERRSFSRREAWLWMLSEAVWKPRRVRLTGATITLERGQFAHSIRFMAKAWRWEKTKVERFLSDLKTETMIATDTATGQTITTICNYDRYQIVGMPYATADATDAATQTRQQRDSSATKTKKENIEEGSGGGTRGGSLVSDEAFQLTLDIGRACGFEDATDWPLGWGTAAPMRVQTWINGGWIPAQILAACRDAMAKKRDGPPESINFFEKPIARFLARQSAPLPVVEYTTELEKVHVGQQNRGTSAIAAAREMRQRLGGEADRGVVVRLPKG